MKFVSLFALLSAIFCITYLRMFSSLSEAPLRKWDESTNVAVVKSTLERRTFPVLFHQSQPFFEKPPLWYFSTMLIDRAVTSTVAGGRLVSAISGFLIVLLTTILAWVWWGSIAAIATWTVLLTTNHLYTVNPGGSFSTHTLRSADTDALHILFFMISFVAASYIPARWTAVLAGVAAGLSVLSKSPLGLVPLLIITILHFKKSTKKQFALAWISAALTILPWYLWMIVQFGRQFINSHFGYHLAARIASPLEGHDKPIWYYINVLMGRHFFLSWEWLAGSAAYLYLQKKAQDKRIRYILAMALATFIIPTLTSTKLAWYLLPFYPFAALIIGAATSKFIQTLLFRHWSRGRTSNS